MRASNSYLANPPAGTVIALGVPPETDREKSTGLLTTIYGLERHVARRIASQHIQRVMTIGKGSGIERYAIRWADNFRSHIFVIQLKPDTQN